MKIREIHIENFGTLSDQSFTFTDGCNRVFHENGWGKSTLAAFIRVMFFGFENERTKKPMERERFRFFPWQGGTYGGYLIFAQDGKEYKLTRQFGSKPSEDFFELRNNQTGLVSRDFSENTGEELFKLDAESFQRTVLIGQNDIATGPTDRIHARIGNVAETTDDITNFEKIDNQLRDELNRISSIRATGQIRKMNEEITGYEAQLARGAGLDDALRKISESIEEKQDLRRELGKEIGGLQEKQTQSAEEALLYEKRKAWEKAAGEADRWRKQWEMQQSAFPLGIPSLEEIEKGIRLAGEEEKCRQALIRSAPGEKQRQLLALCGPVFASGIPDEKTMERYAQLLRRLEENKGRYEKLKLSEEEKEAYTTLRRRFDGETSVDEKAASLISAFSSRSSYAGALNNKKASLRMMRAASEGGGRAGSRTGFVLLSAGAICLAAGLLLWGFAGLTAAGIGVAAFGLILFVAGLVLRGRAKKRLEADLERRKEADALAREIQEDEAFIAETDRQITAFLERFGGAFSGSIQEQLYQIREDYRDYRGLEGKMRRLAESELREEIRQQEARLEEFLRPFACLFAGERDTGNRLFLLRQKAEDLREAAAAEKEHESCLRAYREAARTLALCSSGIGVPLLPGEKPADFFSRVNIMLQNLGGSESEYKKVRAALDLMEKEKDFAKVRTAKKPEQSMPAQEFKRQLEENLEKENRLVDEINAGVVRQSGLLEEKNQLDELAEKLEEMKTERDELQEKERLLRLTKELLTEAKTSFTQEYAAPITGAFQKYYRMINPASDDAEYSFDANSNLVITDHGKARDMKAYSAGSRDRINFCFRMALIEAMFRDEKPVLIMDDPFTNLDKRHLEGAKKLLEEIAKDYQILYFTCHESRR